jgi:hypothetical protein
MDPHKPDDPDAAALIAICLPGAPAAAGPDLPDPAQLACSFCGTPRAQVQTMFAGPEAYICNECVTLCAKVLAERDNQG